MDSNLKKNYPKVFAFERGINQFYPYKSRERCPFYGVKDKCMVKFYKNGESLYMHFDQRLVTF
jgi:hypothetical protein